MSGFIKKIPRIPKRIRWEIEKYKYKKGMYSNKLKILDAEATLKYIEEHDISFYRYGDGEIALMMNEGIPFQKADELLGKRLKELLQKDEAGIKAAIPYCYFNSGEKLVDMVEKFSYAMKRQRRFLIANCSKDYLYLDTSITQMYQTYEEYDFESYFSRVKRLFSGRNITLICGQGIFRSIKYNLLDECASIEYIEAPSKDAFSDYDKILKRALEIPKDSLICIVLGPTAKPLVYDLHRAGYQAWDIGHFIKDYDAYCKRAGRDDDSIAEFFKPD